MLLAFPKVTTFQFLVYVIPVEPFLVSKPVPSAISPAGGARGRRALNSSNLSWANVAASVKCPPHEVFVVDWIINPAKANKATDSITKPIMSSINVKPLDFLEDVKA